MEGLNPRDTSNAALFVGDQVPVHVATGEQGAILIAGMRQGRHIPCGESRARR